MNIEQSVKPIAITLLTLAAIFAGYVFLVSKQESATVSETKPRSASPAEATPKIAAPERPKFVPDRSQDTGLPKFTELAEQAEEGKLSPEITVTGGTDELVFEPEQEMNYQQISVTIALPDGSQIQQNFSDGEKVSITDENLKDGGYNWETQVTPKIEPSVREEMAAIRELGNIEAERKLIKELRDGGYIPSAEQAQANVQSGYFTILDGKIMDGSEDVEPRATAD